MESAANYPQDTAPTPSRQRAHRSSVTSGNRLFAVHTIDGRCQTALRFRDLVEQMTADLGGADLLSEAQRQLVRRAATLSLMAEAAEADVVRDMATDLNSYGMIADRLRRICETLGLERVARPVNDSSYVLSDYFSRPPPNEGDAP